MKDTIKAIALLFVLLMFSGNLSAQTYDYVEDSTKQKDAYTQQQYKKPTQSEVNAFKDQKHSDKPLKDKIFFGGGLGFGFSNYYTQIAVTPMVGYLITPNLQLGIGFVYEYYNYKSDIGPDYSTNNYGFRPFARYMINVRDGLKIFPQIEYYAFSYEHIEDYDASSRRYITDRRWQEQFLIGGGVSQGVGRKGGVNIIALYDVAYDSNNAYYGSPYVTYGSPWVIRVEVAF
ncbi:hypothetical protein [Flammeovirga sp. SubArs3]|uniref:hypothetical protein n=1 Tax=Flammeovirga sp. SubArs3 TaxID=2995316 RepID=UPI00248BE637|nr:hypothetical protein [Flammeovirga sp. SubArs3]